MPERRANKQAALGSGDAKALGFGVVAILLPLLLVSMGWAAAELAGVGSGSPQAWLVDPTGARWSPAASAALAALLLLAAIFFTPVVALWIRGRRRRVWTDDLARVMSSRKDITDLTARSVRQDTARLGAAHVGTGLPLGRAVGHGADLYATYEWSQVWIMGMRAGKTRRVAVPQILSHGGPVVATSNKDDIHDLTRGPRTERGRVWVNDPQEVVEAPASWWWNPLSFVINVERAEQLVAIWAASRTAEDTSGVDPYFEPEGRALAATLLVAAARGGESITRLPDWLTGELPEPGVPDPTDILRTHGFTQMAKDIDKLLRLDKGQRDGVYGTAASFFRWLRDPRYVRWVAPEAVTDSRPQFDPRAFVASTDTLFLLSKEGPGSARAITGALVAAIYAAAEELARSHGGRCRTPILFVLDEAANVCRWPDLPNVYSHAGGRGVLLVTILQAPSQGEETWGRLGFKKLWSFTNVLGIGRGLNDVDALGDLSRLIGDRQIKDRSVSAGTKGHRSSSTSIRSERILDEADLRSLPAGRVVLLASGVRPVLVETRDFTQLPDGWKATASRDHYVTERGEGSRTHA
jgi:type IV secretory pathway TraG/TraD family ATPase VirD4